MTIQGTRLETDEDVRRALDRYRPGVKVALPLEEAAAPEDSPPLFRPTQRPATPLLTVFDDGVEEGETFRLRQECFVIGRSEGDLVLPHDGQVSSRHAELRRVTQGGKTRWFLIDLGSTNGSYVRIGQAVLQHGQEFIIGSTRLRFEDQTTEPDSAAKAENVPQTTQHWQSNSGLNLTAFVTILSAGNGSRVRLTEREVWLGKDAEHCQVPILDDPFVNARHARIRREAEGRFVLENNKSANGVWLRVDKIPLKGTCRFLLGEQQFRFILPELKR